MKILDWNVNGFRAFVQKGKLDWIHDQDPDIVCFQEIKGKPEQFQIDHPIFNNYLTYWNPAVRPGYSGVATLVKKDYSQKSDFGIGMDKFDVEGRVIRAKFDQMYLYNIYFPNGQRGQDRVDYKLEFYKELALQCSDLVKNGNEIIITGDFNTAHNEIDLANPKENQSTSGFLPEERVAFDMLLGNNFIDVFRHKYPEKIQYTWWTYRFGARQRNIGWRLDYFLVTQELANKVQSIEIYDNIDGSDHCPVILSIDL